MGLAKRLVPIAEFEFGSDGLFTIVVLCLEQQRPGSSVSPGYTREQAGPKCAPDIGPNIASAPHRSCRVKRRAGTNAPVLLRRASRTPCGCAWYATAVRAHEYEEGGRDGHEMGKQGIQAASLRVRNAHPQRGNPAMTRVGRKATGKESMEVWRKTGKSIQPPANQRIRRAGEGGTERPGSVFQKRRRQTSTFLAALACSYPDNRIRMVADNMPMCAGTQKGDLCTTLKNKILLCLRETKTA
ncbi:hypothetical protein B0H13DRAFT_1864424 [Mycena leptocephala]|nr:hypothetical protein B0H13DRAFT_1864424 [Mycena leptocephala]